MLTNKRPLESAESPKKVVKQPKIDPPIVAKLYSLSPTDYKDIVIKRKDEFFLGRSSSCDIRIGVSEVSIKHCVFKSFDLENKTFLSLQDVSSNGTWINDIRLTKAKTYIIKSGDKLKFGSHRATYVFKYLDERTRLNSLYNKKSIYDEYTFGNQIGSGHYAVVRECYHKSSGKTFAVKIFNPNKLDNEKDVLKLKQEMNLLISIDHPNIVKFVNHYLDSYNNHITNFLILEKVNHGELFERIVRKGKLRQDETRAIFKQIITGLQYLHTNKIVHRDIKPENILLNIIPRDSSNRDSAATGPWDEDEFEIQVKIADFGLAKFIGVSRTTTTLCGTPAYVAPEILNNNRNYSKSVDLWSAGTLLYVCLVGFPPFSDELGPPSMKEQILMGKYSFWSPYWDEIEPAAMHLISKLLVVDPSQRYDIEGVFEHVWMNGENTSRIEEIKENEHGIVSLLTRGDSQPLTLRDRFISELQRRKTYDETDVSDISMN